MKKRCLGTTLCAAVAIVISLSAQESRPAPQFTIERPVVSRTGPHRLRVDVPLLVVLGRPCATTPPRPER